nr:hypothetical protein [Tanacetum cinerariifolium]GEY81796.1 hypothetical protein [Tanacetum cinerariifolium]
MDIILADLTLNEKVKDMVGNFGWKWTRGWVNSFDEVLNVLVLTFNNDADDRADWVNRNGKEKKFSMNEVRKGVRRNASRVYPSYAPLSLFMVCHGLGFVSFLVAILFTLFAKKVLKELKKLKVNSTKSATSLRILLKEKSRIEEEIKATMKVHGLAILKDALPPKEKDPGSFTLPCSINNMHFDKAFTELGASVSVMPYSTFRNLGLDFIVLDIPDDIKILLILGRPFSSTAHAKIDVFKRKFALRIRNDKIIFMSDSPTSNIIKKDLRDFLKLNDLNKPLELNDHEMVNLDPKIEDGEIIDEPKDMNMYFAIVENMDAYHDKDMVDVIVGKPFCRVTCVEAKRFNGFITIHDGNNSVTYQMARSSSKALLSDLSIRRIQNSECGVFDL